MPFESIKTHERILIDKLNVHTYIQSTTQKQLKMGELDMIATIMALSLLVAIGYMMASAMLVFLGFVSFWLQHHVGKIKRAAAIAPKKGVTLIRYAPKKWPPAQDSNGSMRPATFSTAPTINEVKHYPDDLQRQKSCTSKNIWQVPGQCNNKQAATCPKTGGRLSHGTSRSRSLTFQQSIDRIKFYIGKGNPGSA